MVEITHPPPFLSAHTSVECIFGEVPLHAEVQVRSGASVDLGLKSKTRDLITVNPVTTSPIISSKNRADDILNMATVSENKTCIYHGWTLRDFTWSLGTEGDAIA